MKETGRRQRSCLGQPFPIRKTLEREGLKAQRTIIFFLYTDGVKEATDLQNKLYGPDRLIHALNKISQKTPREILEGISSDIGAFVGEAEQFDDITMLCLDYKKQQEIRP